MGSEKRKRTNYEKITGEFYHNHMHSVKRTFRLPIRTVKVKS